MKSVFPQKVEYVEIKNMFTICTYKVHIFMFIFQVNLKFDIQYVIYGTLIGRHRAGLTTAAEHRTLEKLLSIPNNSHHPLHSTFTRQRNSFIPLAI